MQTTQPLLLNTAFVNFPIVRSLNAKQTSTVCRAQFVPSRFKELAHAVARFAHWAVVFVERLAIVEYLSDVGAEFFTRFVTVKTTRLIKICGLIHRKT